MGATPAILIPSFTLAFMVSSAGFVDAWAKIQEKEQNPMIWDLLAFAGIFMAMAKLFHLVSQL